MGNLEDANFVGGEIFEVFGYTVSPEETGLRWTAFKEYYTDLELAARSSAAFQPSYTVIRGALDHY